MKNETQKVLDEAAAQRRAAKREAAWAALDKAKPGWREEAQKEQERLKKRKS